MKPAPPPADKSGSLNPDIQLEVDAYRPTSRRQRLIIIAVTLATVVILWLLLLVRPGGNPYRYMPPPPAPCLPGQSSGCVGGQTNVQLLPAASAPSAAASATAR